MKRWKARSPKRKYPLSFKTVFLLSIIIFAALTAQSIWLVNKQIAPTLMEIANLETQKMATTAINHAVKDTLQEVDMTELIEIDKNDNGEITSIGFDGTVYNHVVTNAVDEAQVFLKHMEAGELPGSSNHLNAGSIYNIPLGRVTNNALLAQIGPLVPVELTAIGDVDVELNEKVQERGINNTWVRVSLELMVDVNIIIPFATNTETVQTTIPIGMMFIPGEVPNFYSENGSGKGGLPAPAIIPEEEQEQTNEQETEVLIPEAEVETE
ncbi:sporulation protein YunB [Alteribacillus sp. HJP-4]|uniref:sporulation protein YunB n=1 Tax=Alteribacillus sp. HJP-4 TaxID=2775394 RepID=UPI0035CD1B5A